jgi:hypothetical protein
LTARRVLSLPARGDSASMDCNQPSRGLSISIVYLLDANRQHDCPNRASGEVGPLMSKKATARNPSPQDCLVILSVDALAFMSRTMVAPSHTREATC